MELRHLRSFIATAEERHFARAAERLGISAPTLTEQIQALEAELSIRLLLRTSSSVSLTAAGKLFLDEARATVRQAERAALIGRQAARGEIGRIEVGYVMTAGCSGVIRDVLKRFQQEHPAVDINLHRMETLKQMNAIERGELDVGFIRAPAKYSAGIRGFSFKELPYVVALCEDHPLAKKRKLGAKDLAGERFVAVTVEAEVFFWSNFAAITPPNAPPVKIAKRAVDIFSVLTMVGAGMGITIVPECFRKLHIPGVAYRDIVNPRSQSVLALAHRPNEESAPILALMALVRSLGQQDAG